MKMSPYGHQVLVDREGFSLTAYQDSVGVWTIGCGHAATSNVHSTTVKIRIKSLS